MIAIRDGLFKERSNLFGLLSLMFSKNRNTIHILGIHWHIRYNWIHGNTRPKIMNLSWRKYIANCFCFPFSIFVCACTDLSVCSGCVNYSQCVAQSTIRILHFHTNPFLSFLGPTLLFSHPLSFDILPSFAWFAFLGKDQCSWALLGRAFSWICQTC